MSSTTAGSSVVRSFRSVTSQLVRHARVPDPPPITGGNRYELSAAPGPDLLGVLHIAQVPDCSRHTPGRVRCPRRSSVSAAAACASLAGTTREREHGHRRVLGEETCRVGGRGSRDPRGASHLVRWASSSPGKRPVVLFVGTFGGDEPIDVFDAARSCPELDVWVTGDPRHCPPELLQRVLENVRLTGFLAMPEYVSAMQDADLVLTLSTEPTSVMRAAYEAVYVGRLLALSDWPGLRTLFPYAVPVPNTSEGIARGLRYAVTEHERLRAATEPARDLQQQQRRWDEQLRALGHQIDPVTSAPPRLWVSRVSRARGGGRVASGHETGHGNEREIEGTSAVTKIRVAGLPISLVDWTIVEAWARNVIDSGQSGTLCTIAPFQPYLASHDEDYRACLDRAGVVLVDGNGVRLLIAASGRPPAPRLTGRELVERVVEGTLFSGAGVAVVGGSPQAHEQLAKAKPDWYLVGGSFAARPLDEDARVVAQQLDEHDAGVVLIALGYPKQELWSDALARHHAAVYCSIGGAIDTAAGERQPPPDVVTRFGLKFAWRAAQDPSLLPRLARGFSAMPRLLMTARGERAQRPVG
jgi:exopolysaccharide biosynthesis WecB/TagA/CpsF family protein